MASPFSHAVAALSIGTCFYRPKVPKRVWLAGLLCSVIPDLDTIGFRFGIHYGDFWGHRGFTHSLVFAALLAGMVVFTMFRRGASGIGRFALFGYLFLATASHGLLDAMTNGGLGVAFFSPFDNTRYFLPWRPIRVSPISATRFFTSKGFAILQNEVVWIWLPAMLFALLVMTSRRRAEQRWRSSRHRTGVRLLRQKTDPQGRNDLRCKLLEMQFCPPCATIIKQPKTKADTSQK